MPRKPAAEIDPNDEPGAIANLASTKGVDRDDTRHESAPTLESLLAEIQALKKEIGVKDEALTAAQAAALAAAESQSSLQQSGIQAVPTGRKVKAMRLDVGNEEWPTGYKTVGYKEDGRPIRQPLFKAVPVDTWYLKIDIPPMAGWDMKINQMPIVHGATYEVDLGVLQYLNDMIWRAWQHEAIINGKNENIFRKPLEKRIGSRA